MPEGKSDDLMEAAIRAVDAAREDLLLAKASENKALLRKVAIAVVHGAILAEQQRCAEAAETFKRTLSTYPNQEAFNYYENGVLDASVGIKWRILNPKSSTEENLQHD